MGWFVPIDKPKTPCILKCEYALRIKWINRLNSRTIHDRGCNSTTKIVADAIGQDCLKCNMIRRDSCWSLISCLVYIYDFQNPFCDVCYMKLIR